MLAKYVSVKLQRSLVRLLQAHTNTQLGLGKHHNLAFNNNFGHHNHKMEMVQLPVKISWFWYPQSSWKDPQVSFKLSCEVTQIVCHLSALLLISI